jgi:hypothetical protein
MVVEEPRPCRWVIASRAGAGSGVYRVFGRPCSESLVGSARGVILNRRATKP